MTFTPAELRLLAISDSLTGCKPSGRNVGGRPRLTCPNSVIANRRARWRRYEDKKHDRLNAFGLPRKQGGRPKTRPSTPEVERDRKRALAWYYAKKSNQQGHDR